MKKFLPIVAAIGVSALLVGCDSMLNNKTKDIQVESSLKEFSASFENFSHLNTDNITKNIRNYKLSLQIPENATLVSTDHILENLEHQPSTLEVYPDEDILNGNISTEDNVTENLNQSNTDDIDEHISNEDDISNNNTEMDDTEVEEIINNNTQDVRDFSTLYSLTNDIENSCDEFCELKKNIEYAISETENVLQKIKNNEIQLTDEQKFVLKEQCLQLKNLAKQLNLRTSELSASLLEIDSLMFSNFGIEDISLKYMILLNNMLKSNEMLNYSLNSLNMVNNMFRLQQRNIPSNNQGQILYGFQSNNNPAIYKSFYKDEQGNWIESTENNNNELLENKNEIENNNQKKTNIDTYYHSPFKSNIDTYHNNRRNIDTFFNTALLDNEFMYGNGIYNGSNIYGFNPYMQQYNNYAQSNKFANQNPNYRSIDNTNPNSDNSAYSGNKSLNTPNEQNKKFKFKSNVDTYRNENTPTLKSKFSNVKEFFKGFKNPKRDIKNPIYRYEETNE